MNDKNFDLDPTIEVWKEVQFDFDFVNDMRLEVSNFGQVRTFTKVIQGNYLKGSMINGYKVIKLKLFTERTEEIESQLQYKKKQISKLNVEIAAKKKAILSLRKAGNKVEDEERKIEQLKVLLDGLKVRYRKEFNVDLRKRTINYSQLVHRLVAMYFLPPPSKTQKLVIHLDFEKLNNSAINLQWATQIESTAHQQNSPFVIAEKKTRFGKRNFNSKLYKLTETRVMLIKKKILEGKSLRTLAKQFKVTQTQLLRIKRGENWGYVKPAP